MISSDVNSELECRWWRRSLDKVDFKVDLCIEVENLESNKNESLIEVNGMNLFN